MPWPCYCGISQPLHLPPKASNPASRQLLTAHNAFVKKLDSYTPAIGTHIDPLHDILTELDDFVTYKSIAEIDALQAKGYDLLQGIQKNLIAWRSTLDAFDFEQAMLLWTRAGFNEESSREYLTCTFRGFVFRWEQGLHRFDLDEHWLELGIKLARQKADIDECEAVTFRDVTTLEKRILDMHACIIGINTGHIAALWSQGRAWERNGEDGPGGFRGCCNRRIQAEWMYHARHLVRRYETQVADVENTIKTGEVLPGYDNVDMDGMRRKLVDLSICLDRLDPAGDLAGSIQ